MSYLNKRLKRLRIAQMLAWQGIVYNLFLEKISHKRLYRRLYVLSGASVLKVLKIRRAGIVA
jgi:hypothetical protein